MIIIIIISRFANEASSPTRHISTTLACLKTSSKLLRPLLFHPQRNNALRVGGEWFREDGVERILRINIVKVDIGE
jgi:hypothetical protein